MHVYIINSEPEYLDFIKDGFELGFWEANSYSNKRDENGMSISDSFNTLTDDALSQYLQVYNSLHAPGAYFRMDDNDEEEFTDYPIHFDDDTNKLEYALKLNKDSEYLVPTEADYPILITWMFGDDYDRQGSVTTRLFHWESMAKVKPSHIDGKSALKAQYELWQATYAAERQQLIAWDAERRSKAS